MSPVIVFLIALLKVLKGKVSLPISESLPALATYQTFPFVETETSKDKSEALFSLFTALTLYLNVFPLSTKVSTKLLSVIPD